jgi:hypothetical protein
MTVEKQAVEQYLDELFDRVAGQGADEPLRDEEDRDQQDRDGEQAFQEGLQHPPRPALSLTPSGSRENGALPPRSSSR